MTTEAADHLEVVAARIAGARLIQEAVTIQAAVILVPTVPQTKITHYMENLPLVTISLQEYEYLKKFMHDIKCSLKEPEYFYINAGTGNVYIISSIEAEMKIRDRIRCLEDQNRAIERKLHEYQSMYMTKTKENIDLLTKNTSLEVKLTDLELRNVLDEENHKWWQFWK